MCEARDRLDFFPVLKYSIASRRVYYLARALAPKSKYDTHKVTLAVLVQVLRPIPIDKPARDGARWDDVALVREQLALVYLFRYEVPDLRGHPI